jgi:hypothetical protein
MFGRGPRTREPLSRCLCDQQWERPGSGTERSSAASEGGPGCIRNYWVQWTSTDHDVGSVMGFAIYRQCDIVAAVAAARGRCGSSIVQEIVIPFQDHFCNMQDALCAALCVPAPSQSEACGVGGPAEIRTSCCVVAQSLQNVNSTASSWRPDPDGLHLLTVRRDGKISNYERSMAGVQDFPRHDVAPQRDEVCS